jgi:chloramphenicol-sensitive protein RarD
MADESTPSAEVQSGDSPTGFAYGVAAYGLWGIIPLYFRLLIDVPPLQVLAHRAWWSFAVLAIGVSAVGLRDDVVAVFRRRRTLSTLAVSASLIAVNWFMYIYAVSTEQIVQAGLGYFITPLGNMLLGVVLLKESLRGLQVAALGLATAGVALLTFRSGAVPWISLSLATSFSLYAYVRKIAAAEAMVGLFVETMLLAPFALAYLGFLAVQGTGVFTPSDPEHCWKLMIGGIVTTIPLLCFAAAVRRLRMTTMGFLQFLSPTLQVLLAVFLFGEEFTRAHAEAFPLILLAVGLYLADAMLRRRR